MIPDLAVSHRLEVVSIQTNLRDLIGAPFVDGGTGPGYDCWRLAIEVWHRMTGEELPDYRVHFYEPRLIDTTIRGEAATKYIKVTKPPVPALVVFKFNTAVFANHIGVYLGEGKFIHARDKTGVTIERLDHPYWRRAVQGFYVPRAVIKNETNDN